jgi:hypothetical protein
LDFYTRFMKAHVEGKVGLRTFEKLKPYYVRRLKECNTCTCKYYIKMLELRHGFNNMWITSKGVHGKACNYSCDVCSSKFRGIALLNGHNFLVSLTCGVPFCALYNLILFGIIHPIWKVNALIMAQKSSWPTLLKPTNILFFIYNGSVMNLLFMVKLGPEKITKYCGYNTRKPQQRCSLIICAQSWKGLCYTIILPNSKKRIQYLSRCIYICIHFVKCGFCK